MNEYPAPEPDASKGFLGRARKGLQGAASTAAGAVGAAARSAATTAADATSAAAGAAYARARQAVPGTLTLTEPLHGTPWLVA